MDLRNQQIKDTYGNLITVGTVAGTPTTGTLQNGAGSNVTTLTIAGTLDATTLGGTLSTASQTNITSVGTLSGLGVSGTTGLDGAVTINESGADVDFRVEGLADPNVLFVDASVNRVGIGTNTPGSKLSVSGASDLDGLVVINDSASDVDFRVEGTSEPNLIYVDASTNRVGIATSTPGSKFSVSGATSLDGLVQINDSGADVDFRVEGLNDTHLIFADASTDRVGIGTSSPNSKLDIKAGTVNTDFFIGTGNTTGRGLVISTFNEDVDDDGVDFNAVQGTYGVLRFRTRSVERMKIDRNGYVRLSSSSNGIQFNGDTAAANALDDYEQGTFTPTIVGSTTPGTGTYTTQVGRFTKIGNKVTYEAFIYWTAHTGTGNMLVTIPTTVVNVTGYYASAAIGYVDGITLTAGNYMVGHAKYNTNKIELFQYPTGGGSVSAVSMDTSGLLMVSVTYESQ